MAYQPKGNKPELACEGKLRHDTRLQALERLKKQAKRLKNGQPRKGSETKVYQCPYCNGYHIGHTKIKNRIEII